MVERLDRSAASTAVDSIAQFHGVGKELFFGHLAAMEDRAPALRKERRVIMFGINQNELK